MASAEAQQTAPTGSFEFMHSDQWAPHSQSMTHMTSRHDKASALSVPGVYLWPALLRLASNPNFRDALQVQTLCNFWLLQRMDIIYTGCENFHSLRASSRIDNSHAKSEGNDNVQGIDGIRWRRAEEICSMRGSFALSGCTGVLLVVRLQAHLRQQQKSGWL